ncbi:MAG: acyl-[acyl-carrier-protein]--UDP-N-acetylglucosamine O-acyltransferase, partial [Gammaproteobacteria bacterium]|nr:acyl-[acyl-carrier-protein]--UDP-N-acetylglucosamine O-acyltransferase [Gammaproteobacteria bacterium]
GFDKESIAEIREAFKILYKRNYSLQEAIDQIRVLSENCAPLATLVESLESSKKGIHR